MFLNSKVGGNPLAPPLEGRVASARHRAILVGQVWDSGLVESLWTMYQPMFDEGYTLEDVAQMARGVSDEGSGD